MNDTIKNDRREAKRYKLMKNLDIINMETKEKEGDLVTISPHIMLVKGKSKVDAGQQMELGLRLPTRIFGKQNLAVIAKCLWTKPDKDPQFQLCGFEFMEIDPQDANIILGLIMELGVLE